MSQLDFAPLSQYSLSFFLIFFVLGIVLLNVIVFWFKPNKSTSISLVKLFINPHILWKS